MTSSETRLQAAAEVAGNAILASYWADAEPDHRFSPEFEQKMDLLIRNMQQPKQVPRRSFLQKVASIILAIAIGGGIWLAIDTDARAAVFGWIREQYENIFHYYFDGDTDTTSEQSYELDWLPEGYSFHHRNDMAGSSTVMYTNQDGYTLTLSYTARSVDSNADFFLTNDTKATKTVKIGSITADLYLTNPVDSSNMIVWEDSETQYLLSITSMEDETTLIKLVENVISEKK